MPQTINIELDENGTKSILSESLNNNSSDNCLASLSFSASQTDYDCTDIGNKMVTLTVTDAGNNSSECNVMVNIADNINPSLSCSTTTLTLDEEGSSMLNVDDIFDTAADNCASENALKASSLLSQTDFDCSHLGEQMVTLTIDDGNGNEKACMTTIIIQDTENPVAACPNTSPVITLDETGNGALAINALAAGNSSDNCTLTESSPLTTFDCTDVGTQMVMLTATDASDNVHTTNCPINIQDNTAPVITCPENQSITIDLSCNFTVSDYINLASSSDNCESTISQSPPVGTILNSPGTFDITMTATDPSENVSTCLFDLEICIPETLYVEDEEELEALRNGDVETFFDLHFDCEDTELVDFIANPNGDPNTQDSIVDLILILQPNENMEFSTECYTTVIEGVAPLKVDWNEFTAHVNPQEEVVLNWTTSTEINNDYFVVERSMDGYNFHKIGTVTNQDVSNTNKTYNFLDTSPFRGINYYRIKEVEWRG